MNALEIETHASVCSPKCKLFQKNVVESCARTQREAGFTATLGIHFCGPGWMKDERGQVMIFENVHETKSKHIGVLDIWGVYLRERCVPSLGMMSLLVRAFIMLTS